MVFTTTKPANLDILRGCSSHHRYRFTGAAGSDPQPACEENSDTRLWSVWLVWPYTALSPIPKGTTRGTCTSPDFLKPLDKPIQTIQELFSEGLWIGAFAVMAVLVLVRRKIARGSDQAPERPDRGPGGGARPGRSGAGRPIHDPYTTYTGHTQRYIGGGTHHTSRWGAPR